MQSDKNKANSIYIKKEYVHNTMDLTFSIVGTVLLLITLLVSSVHSIYGLVFYSGLFFVYMMLRVLINIKLIFSFNKLVHKISPEHIEFYITKSWTRKREGAVWIGIMYIFTSLLIMSAFGVATSFYDDIPLLLLFLIPTIHIFIIIIYMSVNIQVLDANLKISEKRVSIESLEWLQIRRDQSSYYRQLTIWYVHIILIVPLILMVFPFYRNLWTKI